MYTANAVKQRHRRMDTQRYFYALLLIVALVIFAMWMALTKALAHDWYPIECCTAIDCAPVTSASYVAAAILDGHDRGTLPMPRMVVTTSRGTFVLPDRMPRRVSQDNRMHVCSSLTGTVLCIFEPPGM
jgi:hypothetical protein